MKNKPSALYIHIPFCSHICSYCDFTKLFYNPKFSKPYIEALLKEIDYYNIDKVDTIYIGGGTPTALSDSELELVLAKVSPLLKANGEFTVEANVENLTEAKLDLLKNYGVNRLSIGIQSSNNVLLNEIGRKHTFEDAQKIVKLAQSKGFNSLNVDLIYGFPKQTLNDLKTDLDKVLSLNTDHISIYSLIVEPGSIFYNKGINEQNEDDSRNFYEYILSTLRSNGFKRYEVSNFAKPGKCSRHNMTYWKNNEYYGVGLGASGYLDGIRYQNTKNLDTYVSGNYRAHEEEVSERDYFEYFLLTNLRMEDGFSKLDFVNKFGIDSYNELLAKAKTYIDQGLIIVDENSFRLSGDGMLIMDHILVHLI